MKSFAIVLVCYNRLSGVKRLLRELEQADYDERDDINLIFSIDNSGKSDVQEFAESYKWPHGEKRIRIFSERQGLKKHVLQCGDFTKEYDIVAVFEDDLFVSDCFYYYAYQAAEFYWDEDSVAGISLYSFQKNWLNWALRFEPQKLGNYDSYFMKIAQSWGQIWTESKWRKFKEWYSEHEMFTKSDLIPAYLNTWPESSWLKYHDRYCIETNRYFVYPYVSFTTNFSDAGEHATFSVADHQVELQYGKKQYVFAKFTDFAIKYDEYCNKVGLGVYLGIPEDQLCVDFWATKPKSHYKKFLLSTEVLGYRILRKYSLSLRPIEISIIKNIPGEGIYLYDTTVQEKRKKVDGSYHRLLYSFRSHDEKLLLSFAVKLYRNNKLLRLESRIKRLFK